MQSSLWRYRRYRRYRRYAHSPWAFSTHMDFFKPHEFVLRRGRAATVVLHMEKDVLIGVWAANEAKPFWRVPPDDFSVLSHVHAQPFYFRVQRRIDGPSTAMPLARTFKYSSSSRNSAAPGAGSTACTPE